MTVSGKRAGVEFQQEIQAPLVTIQESSLPALVVGPFYQILEPFNSDGSVNPLAVPVDTAGTEIKYDGTALKLFLDNPNDTDRDTEDYPADSHWPTIISNGIMQDDAFLVVLLIRGRDVLPLTPASGNLTGSPTSPVAGEYAITTEAVGTSNVATTIDIGATASFGTGQAIDNKGPARVVIGFRALRRDYSRKILKTDFNNLQNVTGGLFGEENPVALAMQKVTEIAQQSFVYAIGIDEVTDAEPEGTYGAYLRALQYAAAADTYTMVPLTTSLSVLRAYAQNVIDSSAPEGRKERRLIGSTVLPTNAPNDILVDGVGELIAKRAEIVVEDGGPTWQWKVRSLAPGIAGNDWTFSVNLDLASEFVGNWVDVEKDGASDPEGTDIVVYYEGPPPLSVADLRDFVNDPANWKSGGVTGNLIPQACTIEITLGIPTDISADQSYGNFSTGDTVDRFNQFITNVDLTPILAAVGTGDAYLDLESEAINFLITEVDLETSSVIVQDLATPLEQLTGLKFSESFAIFVEGETLEVTTPLGTEPDRQRQAETLAVFPQFFSSRRVHIVWPEAAVVELGGLQVEVPGYYLAAAQAGLIASLKPEQPHSEVVLPGFVSLSGSNDIFSEKQLEVITAGGMFVYVQDVEGGPVVCRKQYTTDVSSDVTAEASITTVIDSLQKDIRLSTRSLLGRRNLTPETIELVRIVVESVGRRYTSRSALQSVTLNSLAPSTEPGDLTTLLADLSVKPYGPFNTLRVKVLIG